jgi:hypothetical protein
MARSIVLRFDATCFDCGSSLSAGTTARWFGKGRVSCCGDQYRNRAATSTFVPDAPRNDRPELNPRFKRVPAPPAVPPAPQVCSNTLSFASPLDAARDRETGSAARMQPNVPLSRVESLSADTGIPLENLSAGLTAAHVAQLATSHPNQRLLARLQSGARLIVPALHAAHVLRCIEESCIDRVRDVALLAAGTE